MIQIIRREFFVIFLVGISPIFIAYWLGGAEKLNTIIKALLAQEFSIYHALALTAIFFIAKFINHFFTFKGDSSKAFISKTCAVLEEVGNTALGVFRVGTGVLIGFPVLWLFTDFKTLNLSAFDFLFYGAIAFIDVCFLSITHEVIKKKFKGHDNNNEIKSRFSSM